MIWLAENIDLIFEVIGVVVLCASAFVKLFSKYKWAQKISKALDWISVYNTAENQELIKASVKKLSKKK